jgi:hypothetical protein
LAHSRSIEFWLTAFIGGDRDKPKVVVAANGGTDLIYIPDGDRSMARRIIDALLMRTT